MFTLPTLPTVPVVNKDYTVSTFDPARFANSLQQANVPAPHAEHAAELVHGILVGGGAPGVTVGALAQAHAQIATPPFAIDPEALRRVLVPAARVTPTGDGPQLAMALPALHAAIARAAGADGAGPMTGLAYLDGTLSGGRTVSQFLAFGAGEGGAITEYGAGAVTAVKPLGALALPVLDGNGAGLCTAAAALDLLARVHPSWGPAGTPSLRVIALVPAAPYALGGGPIEAWRPRPVWFALTMNATDAMLATIDASTQALIGHATVPIGDVLIAQVLIANINAWDLICKLGTLAALIAGAVGAAAGILGGAPTGVLGVLAAFGLSIMIARIGLELAKILAELGNQPPGCAERLGKVIDDLQKTRDALASGSMSKEEASDHLGKDVSDLKDLNEEMKNANTDDPTGKLGDGFEKAQGLIEGLQHALGG